jgi:hypothetical protein
LRRWRLLDVQRATPLDVGWFHHVSKGLLSKSPVGQADGTSIVAGRKSLLNLDSIGFTGPARDQLRVERPMTSPSRTSVSTFSCVCVSKSSAGRHAPGSPKTTIAEPPNLSKESFDNDGRDHPYSPF